MNNNLTAAEKWLADFGVICQARPTCLMVNRTSMVNILGDSDYVLTELKIGIGSTRIFWSAKDDDWCYLDSF